MRTRCNTHFDHKFTLAPTKLGRGFSGFPLLEVILAIAILAISLAAIGEVARMAFRNAEGAADTLQATLVARSVFAELQCGVLELANAGPTAIGEQVAFSGWSVQIIVEPCVTQELLQVRVLVGRTLAPDERPVCDLVRWFPNPDYALSDASTAL
ncbi:MAG: type IV pilus modification PilV family protein [Aeoliella sp.]